MSPIFQITQEKFTSFVSLVGENYQAWSENRQAKKIEAKIADALDKILRDKKLLESEERGQILDSIKTGADENLASSSGFLESAKHSAEAQKTDAQIEHPKVTSRPNSGKPLKGKKLLEIETQPENYFKEGSGSQNSISGKIKSAFASVSGGDTKFGHGQVSKNQNEKSHFQNDGQSFVEPGNQKNAE